MGRAPGSELQVKAPSSDLNIHLGHRELLKMKARVKLSLPVLCHKPAGSPWVGHLPSPYPSSLVCKMRGLYCLISKSSTARMLWFFVIAFSCTWRKYTHLHFMGRNGETERTWSICPGTTRFFWPQLWNSLANHLISQILFSHWYKIQSYHRIQGCWENQERRWIWSAWLAACMLGPFPFSALPSLKQQRKGGQANCLLFSGARGAASSAQSKPLPEPRWAAAPLSLSSPLRRHWVCLIPGDGVACVCPWVHPMGNDTHLSPQWNCLILGETTCRYSHCLAFLGKGMAGDGPGL